MKDAVLHEDNQMAFLGMRVNPSLISDWVVTGLLLVVAALLRIFAIPHFKLVPGKLQSALEALVSFFRDMAKSYSPHRNRVPRRVHIQRGDVHRCRYAL